MTTASTTVPGPQTWTIDQAAQIVGISRGTAYHLASIGEFPVRVLRLGRKMLVSRAELDAYLKGDLRDA